MKTFLHSFGPSIPSSFRKGTCILLTLAALFLAGSEAGARGVAVVHGPRGGTAVGVRGGYGRGAVAYRGYGYGGVHYGAVGYRAPLPGGYLRVVPPGYRMVRYGGYNCYYVGGVYYRATFYQGSTVYVIVR